MDSIRPQTSSIVIVFMYSDISDMLQPGMLTSPHPTPSYLQPLYNSCPTTPIPHLQPWSHLLPSFSLLSASVSHHRFRHCLPASVFFPPSYASSRLSRPFRTFSGRHRAMGPSEICVHGVRVLRRTDQGIVGVATCQLISEYRSWSRNVPCALVLSKQQACYPTPHPSQALRAGLRSCQVEDRNLR